MKKNIKILTLILCLMLWCSSTSAFAHQNIEQQKNENNEVIKIMYLGKMAKHHLKINRCMEKILLQSQVKYNLEKRKKDIESSTSRGGSGFKIIRVKNEDINYTGAKIVLSKEERDLIEKIVEGEAGSEGLIGKALVAQAIRDAMVTDNLTAKEVWKTYKYTPVLKTPNHETKKAVKYIFEGNFIVKHRILYFYAPKLVKSRWHETQNFVVHYKGHKFFDRKTRG